MIEKDMDGHVAALRIATENFMDGIKGISYAINNMNKSLGDIWARLEALETKKEGDK